MIKNKIFFLLLIFFVSSSNQTLAAENDNQLKGTPINAIIIKGNERVSTSSILSYSEVKVGDVYTRDLTAQIIQNLYRTKYFEDIEVTLDFNNLIITVIERPIITEVVIDGNSIINTEDIIGALDGVGLSRARPFDKNIFDKVGQELVRLYYDRGRYSAEINTSVANLERNRVSISLLIEEGEASEIQGIKILGNKKYSYSRLMRLMDSGVSRFYDFWTDKSVYSGPRLQSDLNKIRDFYFNEGYARFKILSHQVNLANSNKDIFITISIEEGDSYEFGDLSLFGNTVVPPEEAKAMVRKTMNPGELFSGAKIEATKSNLAFLLGDQGYAFPDVIAIPVINDETKVVDVEFRVDPGSRTTIRRIHIVGNENTNDEVYRREIRQFESALHSNSKIEISKFRLQRLKYVKNVEIKKLKVFGSDDQVDIVFNIEESASGEFKVGAGWSDTGGTIFNIKLQQENFLGTGNSVTLDASKSSTQNIFRMVYTDPYFSTDGLSKSTNIVFSQTDVSWLSRASYLSDTIGGGVFYSTPISETDSFGLGYDVLFTDYSTTISSPVIVTHHLDRYGGTEFGVELKANYVIDTRDRTVFARTGYQHRFSANFFAPVTEGASYAYANYIGEYNFPYLFETFGFFDWDTVFRVNTQLGIGAGMFGNTSLPFHSKFFAGGTKSVRGFKGSSLGPLTYNAPSTTLGCTAKTCDTVGGDFLAVAQFSWVFPPPPFLGVDNRVVRVSLFTDIGNVFEDVNDFDYNELRASYGIQADFLTPVGAVTFGFVDTFKSKEGDDIQPIVFQLGGSF